MGNTSGSNVLKQNSKLLTTLLDVSNLVSSTMELKPLLEAILDKLRTIIEYKNARIFVVDGGKAKNIAHRPALGTEPGIDFPLVLDIQCVNDRNPVVIEDLYSDDETAVSFRKCAGAYMDTVYKGVRCLVDLPMVYKNDVIGVLELDHEEPGFYNEYHVDIGMAFASQAAIEYENIKLYEETVKKADEIRTLFNIQQAITSRLELDAVLRLIAEDAGRLTNSGSTAVFLVNGDDLVLSVSSGFVKSDLTGLRIPVSSSSMGESLHRRKTMILSRQRLEKPPENRLVEATDMHTCLCVPLIAGSRTVGVIAAFSRIDGEFNAEDERIFNMFAPNAVIGIENARLYEEEKRRLQENEQRRRVAEGLGDILKALNSNKSLEEILDFIIREAARLLHAESAALFRFGNDKKILMLEASFGMPDSKNSGAIVGGEAGALSEAFMERRPLVMADMSEIRPSCGTGHRKDARLDWLRENYCGIMAVPLICKNEVYGGMALYFKKGGKHPNNSISSEEISLATAFADQAALAIDNTRLREKAEEMAVAAERNRLARDLHDSVTQTLFSASLIAEVVPKMWELNRDEGLKRLEELRQLTRGALAEMRVLLFELRPATLMEAPLSELLKQLAQAVTGRARIAVELDIKGTAKLPPEAKTVFYRVAQEALNNVAKHSGAKKAAVDLRINEDEQLGVIVAGLSVSDDGRGFEPKKVASGHFGLGIMKERAESIGAKLNVTSKPGKGTVVSMEWVGGK
jgi:signal transduction histidine kinase